MEATQAHRARPGDSQEPTRHVELPVMIRALSWVRARRFVTAEVGRRGMFLLTTDPMTAGTSLEVDIPWAGARGIQLHATVQACHGPDVGARGRRQAGWCVTFDDLDEADWRDLEALLEEIELRDSLPMVKPTPAASPAAAEGDEPDVHLSPLRLFEDLGEEHATSDPGAAALDPRDFGRPGMVRARAG